MTNKLSQEKAMALFFGFLLAMMATILLIPVRAQSIPTPVVAKGRSQVRTALSKSSIAILMGQIDPRSKTPAIAGGNKGPAGSIPIEDCSKCRIKDNNSITIDGVINQPSGSDELEDYCPMLPASDGSIHFKPCSDVPNPEFRWI